MNSGFVPLRGIQSQARRHVGRGFPLPFSLDFAVGISAVVANPILMLGYSISV